MYTHGDLEEMNEIQYMMKSGRNDNYNSNPVVVPSVAWLNNNKANLNSGKY